MSFKFNSFKQHQHRSLLIAGMLVAIRPRGPQKKKAEHAGKSLAVENGKLFFTKAFFILSKPDRYCGFTY